MTEKIQIVGFLELKEERQPPSDHIGLCDDDGMPFCLTSLLPLVGRGVRITVELDPEMDSKGADAGNEPLIYQTIGMTPSGYAVERGRMREAARHVFQEHMFKEWGTGRPLSPECSRCGQLPEHEIHVEQKKAS